MSRAHVLIFAKTPYERTPYDQWLEGTGITPILLAHEDCADGYRHLPEVYSFSDYDRNPAVAQTALEIARSRPLKAVFARAEADVIRAAQLREFMDIPGQHKASALAFRDKVIMKDALRKSGVELPTYTALDSPYSAFRFASERGFPLVIKPRTESGSWGTQIVRDEATLDQALKSVDWGRAEIETYVEGQMYHIDGLVIDGEIAFIHPFQYVNDCLSFRKDEYVGSLSVSPDDLVYGPLIEATAKVIRTLPSPRNMAFHCELWRTPDDRVVFCEIASRTGGALISGLIETCFGFNIDKEWLLAECGHRRPLPTSPYRPGGGIYIPPAQGILAKLPSTLPSYVRDSQITGQVGRRYNGGVKSGLFLAAYIVDGESEAAALENIKNVCDWFSQNTIWRRAEGAIECEH